MEERCTIRKSIYTGKENPVIETTVKPYWDPNYLSLSVSLQYHAQDDLL